MKQPDDFMKGLYELDLQSSIFQLSELLAGVIESRSEINQDVDSNEQYLHDAIIGVFITCSSCLQSIRDKSKINLFDPSSIENEMKMQNEVKYINLKKLWEYSKMAFFIINQIGFKEFEESQQARAIHVEFYQELYRNLPLISGTMQMVNNVIDKFLESRE